MAYIVNRRDGNVVATVADGTLDVTSTSITILGKGFNNYGEIVAESLHHMIEHFSNTAAPTNAVRGQIWFDSTDGTLKVNVSDTPTADWLIIGRAIVSASVPTSGFGIGSFWFDTTNNTLNISTDGVGFFAIKTVAVGTPPISPVEGDLFYDTNTKQLKVYNDALHGGAAGFDVIGPHRYSSSAPPQDSDLKDGDEWWDTVNKQLFMFDEDNTEFRLIGPSQPASGSGLTDIIGTTIDGNSVLEIIIDGEIIGIWSAITFTPTSPPVDFPVINRGLNLTRVGTTLFTGTATASLLADVAERYAVDGPVDPGDLVSLGGEAEITKTKIGSDYDVFGVVSTNPGMRLNEGAGPDETHPYIALTGRVPCKVIGPINKGDRLVSSSTPGIAVAIENNLIKELYPCIIGRSLETNMDDDIKLIEITIGIK